MREMMGMHKLSISRKRSVGKSDGVTTMLGRENPWARGPLYLYDTSRACRCIRRDTHLRNLTKAAFAHCIIICKSGIVDKRRAVILPSAFARDHATRPRHYQEVLALLHTLQVRTRVAVSQGSFPASWASAVVKPPVGRPCFPFHDTKYKIVPSMYICPKLALHSRTPEKRWPLSHLLRPRGSPSGSFG